eukprot:759792-Hanusia_phi.AAC.1
MLSTDRHGPSHLKPAAAGPLLLTHAAGPRRGAACSISAAPLHTDKQVRKPLDSNPGGPNSDAEPFERRTVAPGERAFRSR